jgi:hypothetical protein
VRIGELFLVCAAKRITATIRFIKQWAVQVKPGILPNNVFSFLFFAQQ